MEEHYMRRLRVGWLFCLASGVVWGACGGGQNALLPSSMQSAPLQSSPLLTPPGDKQGESFSEQTLRNFFPYREGPPRISGIATGTALAPGNWQLAQEVLPPEML